MLTQQQKANIQPRTSMVRRCEGLGKWGKGVCGVCVAEEYVRLKNSNFLFSKRLINPASNWKKSKRGGKMLFRNTE